MGFMRGSLLRQEASTLGDKWGRITTLGKFAIGSPEHVGRCARHTRNLADPFNSKGLLAAMQHIEIEPFTPQFTRDVIELAIAAWRPVFAKTEFEVPRFVYDAFYPEGWEARQRADVAAILESEPQNIWLARVDEDLAGFIGIRLHVEDQMGEIYIIAVSPAHQRAGIGRRLMQFAEEHIRANGMQMIMVETIADAGHEPARRAYESFGFERWPVARYFKEL